MSFTCWISKVPEGDLVIKTLKSLKPRCQGLAAKAAAVQPTHTSTTGSRHTHILKEPLLLK